MMVRNAKFEITAVSPGQYPAGNMPEVAFAGRSNVGKSSIINTLVNRKGLARVGATPGKTREINFYNVDDKLYFVDLPGYGYAAVSKAKKSSWNQIIETYLNTRHQLKLVIMLVDIRHKPSDDDKLMYEWILDHGVQHLIVATKLDKISRSEIMNKINDIKSTLDVIEGTKILTFSSLKRQGIDEVWGFIETTCVIEK